MATIKDVARLAGVSQGTVSNVINGVKSVNSSLILKVEQAMLTLSYQPDAKARSLKNNLSKSIGVVMPNITDACYAQMFAGIEKQLGEMGYTVSLYISNELAQNEKRIIHQLQQQRMDGAIIITCQPAATDCFEQLMHSGTRLVFLERRPQNLDDYIFACLNTKAAIYETTISIINKGIKHIALLAGKEEYSNEQHCRSGFETAMRENGLPIGKRDIVMIETGKENAFRAATWWVQGGEIPEAIITTCASHAEGAMAAVNLFCDIIKPVVISISEDSWTQGSVSADFIKIPQKYLELGQTAANALLNDMDPNAPSDYRDIVIASEHAEKPMQDKQTSTSVRERGRKLRVLMMDSSASYATRTMLSDFKRQTNVDVEIDVLEHSEIYNEIKREAANDYYDIFQVDIPWLGEFVRSDMLKDLSDYIKASPQSIEGLIPGTLEEYALFEDKFYGIPYMFGTQLLYYRKDLFEDMRYQRLYYEQNKTELQPPRTWSEFNTVAKFFTKEFNSESPTQYGTTLGGRYSSGAVCEFLPRQWAFGGNCFDSRGKVTINRPESIRALKNYAESFQYASPSSPDDWWGEQVKTFCDGQAAMMVMFMSHATDITDRYLSKVGGKIGFSMVPGGAPLLGGWSLGINKNSKNADSAYEFLSWTCNPKTAIPYTILGGSPPSLDLFKSAELTTVYPWLPKAIEAFSISRKRTLPNAPGKILSEWNFEQILGESVHDAIIGKMTPEQAIEIAEKKLKDLF